MKQKESLEYHAVINFIQEYNRTHKRQFIFHHLCKPPMSDALCELNGKRIGIEVVHSYGSGIEAAIRLGNCRSSDFPRKKHCERRISPIDVRSLNSLNERLFEKSKKKLYLFSGVVISSKRFLALG